MDGSLVSTGSTSSGDASEVPVVACNICTLDPPTNPVVTTCGHSFCWRCISRFLRSQAKPCPLCTTILSSNIHVVPQLYSNGSLILYLPTLAELERNYDMMDWINTNTVLPLMPLGPGALSQRSEVELVPGLPRALSEHSGKSDKPDVVVSEGNDNCQGNLFNLFLMSRIEELQWRARRAKLTLLNSLESWSMGRKDQ